MMSQLTRPNSRKEWTAAEIEQLRQMAEARTPARIIARTLGRTIAAVQVRASQLAISIVRTARDKK
jgi:hypothetical protein